MAMGQACSMPGIMPGTGPPVKAIIVAGLDFFGGGGRGRQQGQPGPAAGGLARNKGRALHGL